MTTEFNFRAFIEGIDALYAISKTLGYVQTRGGRGRGAKGEGSPKQMLEAIARGEAIVIRLDRLTPHERERAHALTAKSAPPAE